MKTAYLDCFSGISGDMLLGALIDLGVDPQELQERLAALNIGNFELVTNKVIKKYLSATRVNVIIKTPNQASRNLYDILKILDDSGLPGDIKLKAMEIFKDLAAVESKIHGCSPDEIHFHEIGAVDSIVDIVGGLLGFRLLDIRSVYVSRIPLGTGFTESSHGKLPLPAPATLELLKNMPVYDSGLCYELVTPTGAALIKHLANGFGFMPPMKIQQIGYGAGTRDMENWPNVLRMVIGEEVATDLSRTETIVILESNVDDCSPEIMGYLMERLLESGALDVSFSPIQMKKNRPGIRLEVISPVPLKDKLMEIMFLETPTLGVRYRYCERKLLLRSLEELNSPWGKIKVKKVTRIDGSQCLLPEYEECRKIARENRVSLRQVYKWIAGLNTDR